MTGKLTLVIGPMFAGKTTELQRRVKREIHACRRVCIIRYGKDDRYSKSLLATHDQSHIKPTYSVEKLSEVGDKWNDFDTIAVDEGQFFPDLVEFCTEATDAGKTVIVVGLDGDFRRRPFGKICDLIPLAEEVVKITAVCMACHEKDAHYTRRTVASEATELIGGAEMYIAVCRDCYLHPAPPTPGRVNRYRENVKEVERMCLRGHRTSADLRVEPSVADSNAGNQNHSNNNGGDSNLQAPPLNCSQQQQNVHHHEEDDEQQQQGISACSPSTTKTCGLRRSRSQNQQPCSEQVKQHSNCENVAPSSQHHNRTSSAQLPPLSPHH